MSNEKAKPVCLVTGGTDGVGLATARHFAAAGYRIAACGRDQQRLASAQAEFEKGDVDCLFVQADLSDTKQAIGLGEKAIEKFGRVDVLVNCAAAAPLAAFDEVTEETFENAINLNVRSVFYLTQTIWRKMKQQESGEQGRGVVINISSLAAVDPFPGFSVYGSTKAWIDLMTLALSAEGKDHDIRVYSIRPGAVETKLLRGLFPDFPADQCVQPSDVAQLALKMVTKPDGYESGKAYNVTNQPGVSSDG